jgi:hypothetical protein
MVPTNRASATKSFSFAHETELKQSGEVETRERDRAASLPPTRGRITPQSAMKAARDQRQWIEGNC